MYKHTKLFLSVGVALACASSSVMAAGFQVNEHSASGLGRAFAGQAATPEDATVLTTNAAAISQFDRQQFSISASYINPNIDVEGSLDATLQTPMGPMTQTFEASEDDIADSAIVPSAYYIAPVDDKWTVGIGAFTSYGLRTDYSDDFTALHFADTAEVKSVTLNPTVAYKLTDTLSMGFGVSATYAEAEISTSTPAALGQLTGGALPGNASILFLEGDDWGFGWNAGFFWQPLEGTSVGLSYRAETELELEGDVSSDLNAALNQGGGLDLNLAAITELAVNQKISDRWAVQASVVFTDWSTFDTLEMELDNGFRQTIKEENFDDTWRGALGVTYQLNREVILRAGYAYDDGAVTTENRSLSIPDTDRHWITAGLSYALADTQSIDLGYAYINGREARVAKTDNTFAEAGFVSTFTGEQSANAHIFSVQYNSSF